MAIKSIYAEALYRALEAVKVYDGSQLKIDLDNTINMMTYNDHDVPTGICGEINTSAYYEEELTNVKRTYTSKINVDKPNAPIVITLEVFPDCNGSINHVNCDIVEHATSCPHCGFNMNDEDNEGLGV